MFSVAAMLDISAFSFHLRTHMYYATTRAGTRETRLNEINENITQCHGEVSEGRATGILQPPGQRACQLSGNTPEGRGPPPASGVRECLGFDQSPPSHGTQALGGQRISQHS